MEFLCMEWPLWWYCHWVTFCSTSLEVSNIAVCRYNELRSNGNELLVSLCFHLMKKNEEPSSSMAFIKDTLQMALPSMNCKWKGIWQNCCIHACIDAGNVESCLRYLCQKAPSVLFQRNPSHVTGGLGHMTSGSPPIVVLQHATILLLQHAYSHGDV